MNRERAKELLPIIQAFAEGKEIECRYRGDQTWVVLAKGEPLLCCDNCEYRIKPEPREWLINKQNSQSIPYQVGDIYPYPSTDWLRAREVLE